MCEIRINFGRNTISMKVAIEVNPSCSVRKLQIHFRETVKSVIEHAPGHCMYLHTQYFKIPVKDVPKKQFKMSSQTSFLLFFTG